MSYPFEMIEVDDRKKGKEGRKSQNLKSGFKLKRRLVGLGQAYVCMMV